MRFPSCICLALLLLSAPAWARPASVAVVIDAGETDLFVESLVRATLEVELSRSLALVQGSEVGGETPRLLRECKPGACEVISDWTVDGVVFVVLEGAEKDGGINLRVQASLLDRVSARVLASTDQSCQGCQDEARMTAFCRRITEELLRPAEPEQAPPKPVPAPPAPVSSKPPAPAPAPKLIAERPPAADKPAPVWPIVTLVGGLSALGAGATLLAIDGPRIVDGVRQPRARDTATSGWIALGTGAALLATSAILWMQDDPPAPGQVVVVPSAGGATLSWSGTY